jgi:hypothetical protein
LAAIAMVSAAIAAFFYLRVAVLMYTPIRDVSPGVEVDLGDMGTGLPVGPVAPSGARLPGMPAGHGDGDGHEPAAAAAAAGGNGNLVPADSASALAVLTQRNANLILDDEQGETWQHETPTGDVTAAQIADEAELDEQPESERTRVKVPVASTVAIGLSLLVTVGFGIFPAPLLDFAHKATLFFFPS